MPTLYETNEIACPICGEMMRFCGYMEIRNENGTYGATEIPLWFCRQCWETWNPIALGFYQEFLEEQKQDRRVAELAAGQMELPL